MITTKEIKVILESDDFRRELEEISSYAANIRQERPVVTLIAKHFWQHGYAVALEKKKCDLVVGETPVEFKFSFDFDTYNLKRELDGFNDDLGMLMNAVSNKKLSKSWTVSPAIYKDMIVKRPDIFVWVLCRRDLTKLTEDELSRVCIASDQQWYNRKSPFKSNEREFLQVANRFLSKLQELRDFSLEKITIAAEGSVPPSVYYFMLCDFTKGK